MNSDSRKLVLSRLYSVGAFILPSMLLVVVFFPALGNGLVWDDHLTFEQAANYRETTLVGILKALSEPLIYDLSYYRPLPVLTFMLQLKWFGTDAFGLHLVSILLHMLNTFLLSLLVWTSTKSIDTGSRQWAVFLIGLIYGLHPSLIEPAVFVSSRFDLMTTSFLAGVLLADSVLVNRTSRFITVSFLFFLAAACKEMALALPLCLPFIHLARMEHRPGSIKSIIRRMWQDGNIHTYMAVIAGGAAYLGLRYLTLGYVLHNDAIGRTDVGGFLNLIALIGKSVSQYLQLIFLPFGKLSVSHQANLPITFADPQAWFGWVIVAAVVTLTAVMHIKHRTNPGWSMLAILASLVPVLNVLPNGRPTDSFFAESFLVFPLMVVALMLALQWRATKILDLAPASKSVRRILPVVPFVWIAASIVTANITIPIWKDDVSLWGWVLFKQQKANRMALNNYTNGLILQNRFVEAIDSSRRAVNSYPKDASSWNNLALSFSALNSPREAEQAHQNAIRLDPNTPQYYTSYGDTLFRVGRYAEAGQKYLKALDIDPGFSYASIRLAFLSQKTGDLIAAKKYMVEALTLMPDSPQKKVYQQWLNDEVSGQRQSK